MGTLKKIVFVTTLLLALVGGAGQASADPGKGGPSVTTSTSFSGGTVYLSAGITWE